MDTVNKALLLKAADWFETKYSVDCPRIWLNKEAKCPCGEEPVWGGFDDSDGQPDIWVSQQAPSPVLALFHELHHYLLQKSRTTLSRETRELLVRRRSQADLQEFLKAWKAWLEK